MPTASTAQPGKLKLDHYRHLPETGYKIYDRYEDCGIVGLSDRSRRPQGQANRLPLPVEGAHRSVETGLPGLVRAKIRKKLRQQLPDLPHCPAISTVHAVLDRHGLVHRRWGPHRCRHSAMCWLRGLSSHAFRQRGVHIDSNRIQILRNCTRTRSSRPM